MSWRAAWAVLDKLGRALAMNSTPVSLLERVRTQTDQDAWERFVQLYTPLIFYWARRCGLQATDAADLTQDVFATLFQRLPNFAYDPHKSFRAWLRVVTLNHLRDRQRRPATRVLPGDDEHLEVVEAPVAFDDNEYRRHLMSRSLEMIEQDFQPATWQAFWQHGILGRPAADVAAELGLSLAAIYGAKFRVINRLRQELRGLLD